MGRVSRSTRSESGQVTPYVIIISLTLFGFMAFAIDFGFHFHARRVLQNAADPAVLAGAAYLPGCPLAGDGSTDPLAIADTFADYNLQGKAFTKQDLAPVYEERIFPKDVDEAEAFPSVYARVKREQNFIFGRFLGLTSSIVPAEAEAVCGPIQEGEICPIYIEADMSQPPVRNGSGELISAYGLIIGQPYVMRDSGSHLGGLNTPIGNGTSHWTQFIRDGCVASGNTINAIEGGEVTTEPGNWGNPMETGLEGGNGSNSHGLYKIERDNSTLFPLGHRGCNFRITPDGSGFNVQNYNSSGVPSGPNLIGQDLIDAINAKTDPASMPTGHSPCGGLQSDGTPVPQLLYPSVQGRFMLIALTDGSCNNRCDLPLVGILRMYIMCWTGQKAPNGSAITGANVCETNANNDEAVWGVFADFTAPNLQGGGGLGTNPLSPKHVVLVK